MRYVILGDVHGNYYALEAVINHIKNEYDAEITGFIFTGDYVGDFADGSKVVDLMQEISKKYRTYIVKGNRETDQVGKYLEAIEQGKEPDWSLDTTMGAALISCRELGINRLKYLESLPNSCIIHNNNQRPIFVKHKMPLDPSERERVEKENMVVITGHTHEVHQETKNGITLLNSGSVGLPDEGIIAASYAVIESVGNGDWKFTAYDLKYDSKNTLDSLKNNNELYTRCCGWGKALELSLLTGVNCTALYVTEAKRIAMILEEAKKKGIQPNYDDLRTPNNIYGRNRHANVNYDGSLLTAMGIQEVDGIEVFGSTEEFSLGAKLNASPQPTEEIYLMALDNIKRQVSITSREQIFNERHKNIVK